VKSCLYARYSIGLLITKDHLEIEVHIGIRQDSRKANQSSMRA